MTDAEIARLSDAERVAEGIQRGVRRLSPAIQGQLRALVEPPALAVAGAFFVTWLVSHVVGVGFVVDALFLGIGIVAIGAAVFTGVDELIEFGHVAIGSRSDSQLDLAAEHFARGVSILGVQAVVALLLRRAPQTQRGGRIPVELPPSSAGFVLRPGLRAVKRGHPGEGVTSWWDEITISRLGSATDRRLVALHEAVHRALTPKLNLLRSIRIEGRAASYSRSSFRMYLEEALAETFAQVSVHGLRGALTGIVFPVRNGYVTLFATEASRSGVVAEVCGMYLGSGNVGGWLWEFYFSQQSPN